MDVNQKFLMCSNIDSRRLEAKTREGAIKEFRKRVEREKMGRGIKDYYLCEIVAIDANWDERPHGFTILSDIKWKDKEPQLNRTSDQLERLSRLSDEELKEKVESLEKHSVRTPINSKEVRTKQ